MLAHSPHLPLVIEYFNPGRNITAEDEEGIALTLAQRDRVRRIRLRMPVPMLQKVIMAIDEQYPVLEYLIMMPSPEHEAAALIIPESFQAPRLRHLVLVGFALSMGSRLLTTAVGMVTLCLSMERPSAYFEPNSLHQWISSMPQLETLMFAFLFPVPNRDVERQLMHTPITTHVTLPNLCWFSFRGPSNYMEAVLYRITTPRLEKINTVFFEQLTYSVPRLLRFMGTAENLRFKSVRFQFNKDEVHVEVYPSEEDKIYTFLMVVHSWHLDWQVSSVAQIFNQLGQIFSTVEHLTLKYEVHSLSSEEHNEVDRTEWHKFLKSFSNVKTLRVDDGLVKELSHSLRLDDGERPLDLLPELQELQELTYSASGDRNAGHPFIPFVNARKGAGRPVTLTRRRLKSSAPSTNND
jgi:hypothetical protein